MKTCSHSRSGVVVPALLLSLAACSSGSSADDASSASSTKYWQLAHAQVDAFTQGGASQHIDIPGLGTDFVPAPGTTFVETPNGRAHLVGTLVREVEPGARVAFSLRLGNVLRPGMPHYDDRADPITTLSPAAYTDAGGPVDVAHWRYYGITDGELVGLGDLLGARLALGPGDDTGLQCGLGANNVGVEPGAAVRLAVTVLSQPNAGTPIATDGTMRLHFALKKQERTYTASSPGESELGGVVHPVLSAPGIGGDYLLVAGGAFYERFDGSARYDGVVASATDPTRRFALSLHARSRIDAASPGVSPDGSPKLEMAAEAYKPNGGPIDVERWHYYRTIDGTLRGLGLLHGAELRLRRGEYSLQAGVGAAGSDSHMGVSAGLLLEVTAQPVSGDPLPWQPGAAQLHLPLRKGYIAASNEALLDPTVATQGGFALRIPGLADDFVVVSGGEFGESDDGLGFVRAEIESLSNPAEQWRLELGLRGRSVPSDGDAFPAGSPVLGLSAESYDDQGGPIDPLAWQFYSATAGHLCGVGARAGARIDLQPGATAIQVGLGASNANLEFGASGPLQPVLASQPTAGPPLPDTFAAADLALTVVRSTERCARGAHVDHHVHDGTAEYALRLPGVAGELVLQMGALLDERADGTATLIGTLRRAAQPTHRFQLVLELSGRVDPGAPVPEGSPRLQLLPGAYVDGGGIVDPATWHYYVNVKGSLSGQGAWTGASLHLSRSGPAFQVGEGASGRNLRYGASGWFAAQIVAQPNSGPPLTVGNAGAIHLSLFDSCP